MEKIKEKRNMKKNIKRTLMAALLIMIVPGMLFAAISRTEAEDIALRDAGVERTEFLHTERGREDGRTVYDVEFYADGTEYDYEIDAETGAIISKDFEAERYRGGNSGEMIDEIEAEEIALADAGLSWEDAEYFRTKMDRDHGMIVYEVEFSDGHHKYEYSIAADGGRILEYSEEVARSYRGGDTISIEEASRIALNRVPGATDKDIMIRAERDDGRRIYEGSIWFDRTEYEFEIDAATGRIIEWDRDRERDGFF